MNASRHEQIVRLLMDELQPRAIVREVIEVAYAVGYERFSDGITGMHQLAFRGTSIKHPLGVGHDLLYALGKCNPWLPVTVKTDTAIRRWDDLWFRDGMIDFKHPVRGRVWGVGLRLTGYYGWYGHRREGNPQDWLRTAVLIEVHEYRRRRLRELT